MEPTTKNRVLYIVLAVLIVLNVASVGSMWLMRSCGKPPLIGSHMPPGMQHPGMQHPGMQPPGMQHPPGEHMQMDGKMFLAEELRFTPEQGEKFAKLRDEHFESSRKLIDEMHKSMDDMMELIKSGGDEKKAEEYAALSSAKQKELQLLSFRHFKSVREICDEKQKEKFDLLLKDITKKMGPKGPPPR
ncbi:MAG: periplasmic heavy metal sensor [Ignavibacteriae bacterium]|nr:periplasmic heavy metal sensor [Ignavibacteriota bacterium]